MMAQNKANVNVVGISGDIPLQIRATATIPASASANSVISATIYPYSLSSGVTETLVPLDEFWHVTGFSTDATYTPNFAIQILQTGVVIPSNVYANSVTTSLTNPYRLQTSMVVAGGKTFASQIQITAANGTSAVDVAYTILVVRQKIRG